MKLQAIIIKPNWAKIPFYQEQKDFIVYVPITTLSLPTGTYEPDYEMDGETVSGSEIYAPYELQPNDIIEFDITDYKVSNITLVDELTIDLTPESEETEHGD